MIRSDSEAIEGTRRNIVKGGIHGNAEQQAPDLENNGNIETPEIGFLLEINQTVPENHPFRDIHTGNLVEFY